MPYTTQQVTIDLQEYNDLKTEIEKRKAASLVDGTAALKMAIWALLNMNSRNLSFAMIALKNAGVYIPHTYDQIPNWQDIEVIAIPSQDQKNGGISTR